MNDNFTRTTLPAAAHGWVRMPALDTHTHDAWEMPNGSIYAVRKGNVPQIVTIWQEAEPK